MTANEKSELLTAMDCHGANKTSLKASIKKTRSNFAKRVGKGIYNFCALFCEELLLNGSERVDRELLEADDFILNEEDKVADYDIKALQKHWKENIMKKTFRSRIKFAFRNITRRTFPTICLYLITFYLLTTLMIVYICPSSIIRSSNETTLQERTQSLTKTSQPNEDICKAFVRMHTILMKNEVILNGILTFLVGFYVSFIVRNWWQNFYNISFR